MGRINSRTSARASSLRARTLRTRPTSAVSLRQQYQTLIVAVGSVSSHTQSTQVL